MKLAPLLPVLALIFALACSDDGPPSPPPTPDASATVAAGYQFALGETVWQRLQRTTWYRNGTVTPEGANLLDVMLGGGALWREADSIALIEAYPDGISDDTLELARDYARMTLSSLHEVILDPWLVDGIDEYERSVLAAVEDRVVSVAALRRALADGFFRETYAANPEMLTPVQIDAIGSMSPHVLEMLESRDWFSDGIDSYEASLLGILNTLLSVDEQVQLLETGNYRPLHLQDRDIAVVYLGNNPERIEKAHSITEAWMHQVEAFVGEYRPIGLVVDVTPVADAEACHTRTGGVTEPGRVSLPQDYCFQTPVLIHELAHAFIGGRYPVWFAEGVAEVTAFHLTGSRAGYRNGEGAIQLEGQYLTLSPQYLSQASLGADFLEALYSLAGDSEMSAFISEVAGQSRSGAQLLERIRQMEVPDHQQLEALIAGAFAATATTP